MSADGKPAKLTVATFNTEWRRAHSDDAVLIRERLGRVDIVCLTEADRKFFGEEGHVLAAAGPDGSRTKVLLWSRQPWTAVDEGESALAGYYLAATTDTALGPLRVYGIVIPYRFSGVRYGNPKRQTWELHRAFLTALDDRLPNRPERSIVLGDFNQRIPRKYQPQSIFDELDRVVLGKFAPATAGLIAGIERQAIDHICLSPDLQLQHLDAISNVGPAGRLISDHFGLRVKCVAA
ncbi:hypothetical protein GRI42_13790 [Erythrobacter gaetbuli]|uniref:Endonuclease/exonuclease/phosphatase domain-containing protein n=1 Tax=Qipengyuania gaetbuli TaxID=266952 RepID=A0A844Y5Q9_9SPHN|nr:endonuclease/exonuclease/phosphatase family protein [Qipengyuania gaetbuli]MXO52378.1 hypothetical protein [Qipengyuania gaetbuli]